jgi:CheY-like chemotaxis protein
MPDEARRPESARPATVLVIDDDPAMVESLAMMLEDHGFRVLTANNGVRGLEVFREQRPAAVLTDILMPEQDGIGAIIEMRRERPCGQNHRDLRRRPRGQVRFPDHRHQARCRRHLREGAQRQRAGRAAKSDAAALRPGALT